MKEEPVKLSVITVTMNAVKGFLTTARSIAAQDFLSREWIVIDGGSNDGTIAIIRDFDQHITYWTSGPDRGIYDAMNKGLAKAGGEWVIFMNAGDFFPDKETLTRIFSAPFGGADVIYGDALIPYGKFTRVKYAGQPGELVKGMVICHQAICARRSLFPASGFDPGWPIGADFCLLLQWWKEGREFFYTGFPTAVYDNGGVTSRGMYESALEHYRIVKKVCGLTFNIRIYHLAALTWFALLTAAYRIIPGRFVFTLRDFLVRHIFQTQKP